MAVANSAAERQAQHDRNSADTLPTCPRCADICADTLYCPECGARLYTLESGRYDLDAATDCVDDGCS